MSRINAGGVQPPKPTATVTPTQPTVVPMVESQSPTTTAIVPAKITAPAQALTPPTKRLTDDEVSAYGSKAIAKVGSVSDDVLKASRAGDMDVIGKNLGDLLLNAGKFDPAHLSKSEGFFGGLLAMGKTEIQRMRNNFDSVYGLVEQLARKTEGQIKLFAGRIHDLEALYNATRDSFYEMSSERAELEHRIAQEKAFPPAFDPADPFSANEHQKWEAVIAAGEHRVQELTLQMTRAQQTGVMVTMMAANSSALVKKFNTVLDTTLPELKNEFALAIYNAEQTKGVQAANNIDAFNNEVMRRNAETLGKNVTEVQTALGRNSIELSTLQYRQDIILHAFDEAKRIHDETAQRLAAERPQAEALSKQLVELQTRR